MNTLKICLFAALLFSCGMNKEIREKNLEYVIISGVAKDSKAGAVVQVSNERHYYIDGYEYWSEDYLDKNLVVSGDLYFVDFPQKRQRKGQEHQEMDDYYLIRNPKIELVNE